MLGKRKKKAEDVKKSTKAELQPETETVTESGDGEPEHFIRASVLSFIDGLAEYDLVDLIRIKSRKYNLLILKDYMPVLGELENAKVEIVTEGRNEIYDNVSGYFIHADNRFELLITEDDYVE